MLRRQSRAAVTVQKEKHYFNFAKGKAFIQIVIYLKKKKTNQAAVS